jgi:DNA repair exonuclease SbcCD ATPase subunit
MYNRDLKPEFRGDEFKGDEAQRKIEELVGLGLEDFQTTSYFAQGQTAGMIRKGVAPGERTSSVARWLKLEPLEKCASSVRASGSKAEQEVDTIRRHRLEPAKHRFAIATLKGCVGETTVEEMRAQVPDLEKLVREWEGLVTLANESASNARLAEERAKIIEEGKRLRAEHDAEDGTAIKETYDVAVKAHDALKVLHAEAAEVERRRRSVAMGTFDGACPVSGRDCPVADEINSAGEEAHEAAKVAIEDRAEVGRRLTLAQSVRSTAELKLLARRSRVERLKGLQERVRSMSPAHPPVEGALGSLDATRVERDRVVGLVADLKRRIKGAEDATAEIAKLEVDERLLMAMVDACREAAAIFGRGGAQRRLAEGVLGEIARKANAMLASAGVELTLDVTWESEGKGVADECRKCGCAFPASTKTKKCVCGEPRGPKMVQRLDVELSARSGAAEDLAGLALSLSAGAWLRGDRASSWGVVMMDEPAAQLDRAHRRAFAAHIPSLLTSAHVQQAFIISHDPASVASLPGQICIVSDGTWSRVTVAA